MGDGRGEKRAVCEMQVDIDQVQNARATYCRISIDCELADRDAVPSIGGNILTQRDMGAQRSASEW